MLELRILVVLHQMVIRVARKGERIEPKCVHLRQVQQTQVGVRGLQMGMVEVDQIVTEKEVRPFGQLVQIS